jgi:energy-coupling factor transporter ATP-binding protein EcfA2
MKRRLAIACALAFDPQIAIFDESWNSIERKLKNELHEKVLERWHEKTIICISHQEEDLKFYKRRFLLENGILQEVTQT